ncbi:MAG TPA: DUF72 domain-containing protein [bacterium]|nr:DUF72 domain-containing protein [bacterium]HOL50126.1 DUF72 domain-containing protein [bacterium]HPO51770.1 DUF72 domain-containing protein [bacterium]
MEKEIRIGTSGFSFSDWKGVVYSEKISASRMLEFYAKQLGFNAVEINSTYYQMPSAKNFETMVKKTPQDFLFVVKAFKGMTHDPFDNRLQEKPDRYQVKQYFLQFKDAIKPILENNKLGAVLMQFPVFFYPSKDSMEYILQAKQLLENVKLVVEFRNISWADEKYFDFLEKNNVALCAVDEPKIPRLMPLLDRVTSSVVYLRCHGRNPNWFNTPVSERYNYNYSELELKEIERIARLMIQKAQVSFIFFNNCHAGYAAKNAVKFAELLDIPLRKEELF